MIGRRRGGAPRTKDLRSGVCAGLVLAALVTACSSSPETTPPPTTEPTPTTVAPQVDDGVLRIGVLVPISGEGAPIGVSELAAVRVAVAAANGAGGVNGTNVELIHRNEAPDPAVSLQQLLAAQVDVLIGPAASNNAIALAPTIVQSGVAACSPSAAALALDDFPDDGLLFRTIPSDSLQAEAMAEVIELTGDTSASIVYVDDGYGRPFQQALESALGRRGIEIDDAVGYAADDSLFDTEADRVVKSGDGAVALIGDPDAGPRVLAAIAAAMGDSPRDVVVNDALRIPFSLNLVSAISDETRELISGVSAYVRTDDEELLAAVAAEDPTASGLFATQAYDCANLFMLAAEQTGSTQSDDLKAAIPGLSTAGSDCSSFQECKDLLDEGRRINYRGPSGSLILGTRGDPLSALFDRFSFDQDGRDTSTGQVEAVGT